MRNIGLKIFSVAIALVLAWYVHSESNNAVKTFMASVDLRQIPAGKIVVAPTSPSVQVTVKGPSFIVARIANSPLVFPLSMSGESNNRYHVVLDPNSLLLPPYVDVLAVEPSELDFNFENLVTRELSVVVPRVSTLDDSFRLDSVDVSPDKIEVTGPQSEVDRLRTLETEPIDLHTIHESARLNLALRTAAPLTKVAAERVSVNVTVSPVVNNRDFGNIPLEIHARPGLRYRVEPAFVDIVVSGPKKEIAALQRQDVQAYVRLTDGAAEASEVPVSVEVPPELHVLSVDPKQVKLLKEGKALPIDQKGDGARAPVSHAKR